MRLSIILPVHNERENLRPLLEELSGVLSAYPDSEVIAVDDGSTDGSHEVLEQLSANFRFIRVISLATNYGQTAAIAAGMDAASGEVLLPMDADLQNDPADIPTFMQKIGEGYDIVSGWRRDRHDAWLRSFLSRLANKMIRVASGQSIHDYGCTMKAYRKSVVEHLGLYGDMHRFLAAYAAVNGANVSEIVVHHRPRTRGLSKYGFGRVWRVLLDLFLLTFFLRSFTRPMQFFGAIGLSSIVLGMLTIVGAVIWREIGGPTLIETPLPVLSALFVIVGIQCALMGLLAEMLMRTYFQSSQRKPYLIRVPSPQK
ncbi:glycosyltransferase [Candidatus Peribacteria bacterium]|nr:glycosyltransferase [Candidatus Peribacteria bacterium]